MFQLRGPPATPAWPTYDESRAGAIPFQGVFKLPGVMTERVYGIKKWLYWHLTGNSYTIQTHRAFKGSCIETLSCLQQIAEFRAPSICRLYQRLVVTASSSDLVPIRFHAMSTFAKGLLACFGRWSGYVQMAEGVLTPTARIAQLTKPTIVVIT